MADRNEVFGTSSCDTSSCSFLPGGRQLPSRGQGHRSHLWPDERLDRRIWKESGRVSVSPPDGGAAIRVGKASIALDECLEQVSDRGVARRPLPETGRGWLGMGALPQNSGPSKKVSVLPPCLLLDRPDCPLQKSAKARRLLESCVGQGGGSEMFGFGPALLAPGSSYAARIPARAASPVEPSEAPGPSIEHERQAAEARPVSAASNEPFLHSMGEHIPNAPEQGGIVEDRLSRVTTLPEAPAPSDELPALLRDV